DSDGAPMHITQAEQVLCQMVNLGFKRLDMKEVPLFVYQKTEKHPINVLQGLFFYTYYRVRMIIRIIFKKIGIYHIIKEIFKRN
ncbi:hypothetical protein ACFL6N_06360, partial [Thermodesulfobacteriota bacterium]